MGAVNYLGRQAMKDPAPMHWGTYTTCAVASSIAVTLLLISDLMHVESLGRWGLLAGLLAAVMAAAIIAQRCAKQLEAESEVRAALVMAEAEAMMARHAGAVMKTYEDQTEEIAHAVCDAVMDVFDSRRAPSATPIKPRR